MNHFIQWLNMGGYAAYVWSAYGLTLLVFVLNGMAVKRQRQRTKEVLAAWFKRWGP